MRFVRIFWKKKIQEAYLPKTSIVGQNVSEILAQLCSDDSMHTNPFKFELGVNVWTLFSGLWADFVGICKRNPK